MRFPLIPLAIALSGGLPVVKAEPEPIVHMLVPGFTVRQLPVRISNINNLRFGPDGRLFAMGYDGRIHALRDTNRDGLEDQDDIFWDKPPLIVPVGMAWSKDGLYVSSHAKVSLLRDTDRDGKADIEEVIAAGWPPTDVGSGSVDTTAVTLDQQGNIYFGLSTPDYSNPYRVKDGVSRYDVNGVRGTIQKWSRKTKQLETIATGIRIPYTLEFNRNGDLFLSDQEGQTWCPNGNPLDELNHIIPGRNYGFPPRHEKYLPNLISEPPVVGFGPQHQSSCGFVFNEPKKGQGLFGPKWWVGDAFVAGESRGKIWRVKMIKTSRGYVGKDFIIARLSMLTTDVTISPKGDLYVSCHSGPPDWGTGPKGEGKIFKISYTDKNAPQPVLAWAAGPMEVRVAFDKSLDSSTIDGLTGTTIEFGEYVRAADRYEVLKPPYQVVKQQEATSRGKLRIVSAKLSDDQRTVLLTTDPHPQAVTYALTLPWVLARGAKKLPETVDVDYDLTGVEYSRSHSGETKAVSEDFHSGENWRGRLPHLETAVAKTFSAPALGNETFSNNDDKPVLKFDTRIQFPKGKFTVYLESNYPFSISTNKSRPLQILPPKARPYLASCRVEDSVELGINVTMTQPRKPFDFRISYSSDIGPTRRNVPLDWFYLPWTSPYQPLPLVETNSTLTGADFQHGKDLFFSEQLKCATCHRIRGEGATVGPDLSNLVSRDMTSVLRDLNEPSATIHPDYVAYIVSFRNGDELTGFVRAQSENTLRLVGADQKETILARNDVRELRTSAVSLMPTGLLQPLKEAQVRDLLVFLGSEPPRRAPAEVQAALAPASTQPATGDRPLNIVLVASEQDHGPGEHDYPGWQKKWHGLLGQAARVSVTDAWGWPSIEHFQKADVIVFYLWNHDWSVERFRQLDDFQSRGGGVVLLHAATIADKDPEQLAERIGLAAQPGPTKYLHTPFDLNIVAPTNHPIARGLPSLIHYLDEPYWPMFGKTNKIEVIATTAQEGKSWPMIWTFQKGKGRVFASILGHYSWTHDDPLFRIMIFRGIAWAAGEPPTRFDHLASAGAGLD